MTDKMTTLEAECILKNHGFPDQRSADAAHVLMTSHAALTERVGVQNGWLDRCLKIFDERGLVGQLAEDMRAALKDTQ